VRALAWRPDGNYLATASWDPVISVWDVRTGRRQASLQRFGANSPDRIEFNADGGLLAASDRNKVVRLWDPLTGVQLLSLDGGHVGPQFDASGRLLGWTLSRGKLTAWELIPSLPACRTLHGGEPVALDGVEFSPDGRLLVGASTSGGQFWDCATWQEVPVLGRVVSYPQMFAVADGSLIGSRAGADGLYRWPIRLVQGAGGRPGQWQIGPPQRQDGADDLARAVRCPSGGVLPVVDRESARGLLVKPRTQTKFEEAPYPVALTPDDRWLAVGGTVWVPQLNPPVAALGGLRRTPVTVWDRRSGAVARRFDADEVEAGAAVAFTGDNRWLVTCGLQECRLWDVGSWAPGPRFALDNPAEVPVAPGLSADGRLLAIAHARNVVRLIDLTRGQGLARWPLPQEGRITSLTLSRDGTRLAAGCDNNLVHVWDLRHIRGELARADLDWDAPLYPPARQEPEPPPLVVDPGPPPLK
jgi:WD40 repeat protein